MVDSSDDEGVVDDGRADGALVSAVNSNFSNESIADFPTVLARFLATGGVNLVPLVILTFSDPPLNPELVVLLRSDRLYPGC